MTVFILGALALLLGYLFYSRVLQGMFRPFRSPTPAYSHNDGVDFVPMPTWKNHMIELLNIAGTGPIFDATNTAGLKYAAKYVRKTGNQSAAMYFAVDDARAFADRTETEYLECRPFFTDARRVLKRKTGLYTRIAMKVVDRDYRAKLIRLRL